MVEEEEVLLCLIVCVTDKCNGGGGGGSSLSSRVCVTDKSVSGVSTCFSNILCFRFDNGLYSLHLRITVIITWYYCFVIDVNFSCSVVVFANFACVVLM